LRGRVVAAVALSFLGQIPAGAGEPEAVIVLHASGTFLPGQVAEAFPARFVLLEDGTVYVGGTSDLASVRLERDEIRAIEKSVEKVRKIPGLGSRVSFGPGPQTYSLSVRKGKALDVMATGDPASAPPGLRPLAALVLQLAGFEHPGLHYYRPAFYAVTVRQGRLPGGCRPWSLPVSLAQALVSPQPLAASAAEHWPTGGNPAAVCSGDKTYVVALRPLLPGEKP
jgi:hypothetical protein